MTELQKLAALKADLDQRQELRKEAAVQKLAALVEIAQMSQALDELQKEAGVMSYLKEKGSRGLRKSKVLKRNIGRKLSRGPKAKKVIQPELPGLEQGKGEKLLGKAKGLGQKIKNHPTETALAGSGLINALMAAGLLNEGMNEAEMAEVLDAAKQYGIGTGAGAIAGMGIGSSLTDNPFEGAVYGGLAGAPTGAGLTYLARLAKEKGWV